MKLIAICGKAINVDAVDRIWLGGKGIFFLFKNAEHPSLFEMDSFDEAKVWWKKFCDNYVLTDFREDCDR